MINFTVYSADCVGNSGNCLYPNKNIVTDKESFIKATKMDHVTAKYKGNYRSKDNFESSDCIPLDCDNDHSDNPNEWVTPLDIALEIPGVTSKQTVNGNMQVFIMMMVSAVQRLQREMGC